MNVISQLLLGRFMNKRYGRRRSAWVTGGRPYYTGGGFLGLLLTGLSLRRYFKASRQSRYGASPV